MTNTIYSHPKRLRYFFEEVKSCEMCGDNAKRHIVLAQRLNQSQGISPKKKTGISVSIMRCKNWLTHISPMHNPFHLYESGLQSFEKSGERLGYKVEKYQFDVSAIAFVPQIFYPLFRKYMEWTKTGLQLTVYLRKGAQPTL